MKLRTRIFDALTEYMASLESLALFEIGVDDGRMLDPRLVSPVRKARLSPCSGLSSHKPSSRERDLWLVRRLNPRRHNTIRDTR